MQVCCMGCGITETEKTMNHIRFVSLSSGSSGNCYYLGTDSYGILIDAGISARQIKKSLAANGIAFESIVALCITHDHADHVKGAGYVGEKCGVPVYTTQTILNGMNRCYCMTQKIYSVGRPILKDVPFTIRDFTVTAFEVPHDGTDNVGYRIEAGGRCFVFATDLGCIPDSVAGYLQQAHCLILESNYDMEMLQQGPYPYYLKKRIVSQSGHLCNTDAADFLATHYHSGLEYVFLCHLSRENNTPELAYKTIEARLSQSHIQVGRDVQLVPLRRNTASEVYVFPVENPEPCPEQMRLF